MDAIRGLCVEKGKQALTAAMFMYNMYNDHSEYEDTLLIAIESRPWCH